MFPMPVKDRPLLFWAIPDESSAKTVLEKGDLFPDLPFEVLPMSRTIEFAHIGNHQKVW